MTDPPCSRAGVIAPTSDRFYLLVPSRTRQAFGQPHVPSHAQTPPPLKPPDLHRGITPRHLAVTRRRLAKGHMLLCLDALWICAYHVERRDGLPSRNLTVGEIRPSRLSLGKTVEDLWNAPKHRVFMACTLGHTWSWPQKIRADPVRPTTQGRATRAPAPRLAVDGRTKIRCTGRVTTTQASHMGCSWLIAACVVATSAPIAGLQPSNRQL
jgi:hypothetical protein